MFDAGVLEMSHRLSKFGLLLCGAAMLLLAAAPVDACSVCQGNPDSELVKGAQGGVVVMIVVTYGVLLGFGAMVALWFVRARRLTRPAASMDTPHKNARS